MHIQPALAAEGHQTQTEKDPRHRQSWTQDTQAEWTWIATSTVSKSNLADACMASMPGPVSMDACSCTYAAVLGQPG